YIWVRVSARAISCCQDNSMTRRSSYPLDVSNDILRAVIGKLVRLVRPEDECVASYDWSHPRVHEGLRKSLGKARGRVTAGLLGPTMPSAASRVRRERIGHPSTVPSRAAALP